MKKNTVYLEVSDNAISVIEGKSNNKGVAISHWAEEKINSLNKENLTAAISCLMAKRKKTTINLLLSNSNLLMKTIEIPGLKEKEIQSLIENNLSHYFTLGQEEYVSSFKILNKYKKNDKKMLELLLIAYPKQELDIILAACSDNLLTVNTIEPYSNVIFQEYAGAEQSIAILDVQENKANCVIIRERHLFLHATFNPNETDAFSFSENTPNEVVLSNLKGYLNFYASKNYGGNIEQILLFTAIDGLKEKIEDKTGRPVRLNEFPFQVTSKKDLELREGKNLIGLLFFMRNGVAKSSLNLLNHSSYKQKKGNHFLIISAMSLIVLLMAHSIANPFYTKSNLESKISDLNEELYKYDQTASELEILNELRKERNLKENALKGLKKSQYDFPFLVSVIYSLLPVGVNIEQFVVKEGGFMSIQFGFEGTLLTSELTNALNGSGYFEKVYLENVSLDDRKEVLQLDITLREDQQMQFLLGGIEK